MLCETENINKNPKYRIIKYKDEYLMIDLVSTWLALFFPMINWLIPKKYVKISEKDFETLNIVKTAKINSFWPVAGSTVLFGVMLRRYSHLFIVKYEYSLTLIYISEPTTLLSTSFAAFCSIKSIPPLILFDLTYPSSFRISTSSILTVHPLLRLSYTPLLSLYTLSLPLCALIIASS
ncbi:DUF443 family protein, partial [Staphylococcus aureus]|uniref:DUF443 family protein n=1 Tax=Staphylococcus aureus TaxID=1280 RepID=UPI001EEF93DD